MTGGGAIATSSEADPVAGRPGRRHPPHAAGATIAATINLANEGKLGPDDTVASIVSGNGDKTRD